MFKWTEKVLSQKKYKLSYFEQYNRFKTKLCAYHRIESFINDDTYISFEGQSYDFVYKDGTFRVIDKGKDVDGDATSSSSQNIMQRANKGVDQLWHTFDSIIKPRYAKQSKDIEQLLSIDFYVVFDKNLETTRANSELMDLQTQFLEDKKHMLYFDNEKTFK